MKKLQETEPASQLNKSDAQRLGEKDAPQKPSFELLDLKRRVDLLELFVCQILNKQNEEGE